jgi:hypoxanthine phosphoribosyltransferase
VPPLEIQHRMVEGKYQPTFDDVAHYTYLALRKLTPRRVDTILGIARGGLHPAQVATKLLDHKGPGKATTTMETDVYSGQEAGEFKVISDPDWKKIDGMHVLAVDDVWDKGISGVGIRGYLLDGGALSVTFVTPYMKSKNNISGQEPDATGLDLVENIWIKFPDDVFAEDYARKFGGVLLGQQDQAVIDEVDAA